jgi:hypothetical protein
MYPSNLHEAAQDLYEACLNAVGAHEVIKLVGADKMLPGYQGCVERLNKAIKMAQGGSDSCNDK